MERRKAIKLAAAALATGGIGTAMLTTAFKTDVNPAAAPQNLKFKKSEAKWSYVRLNPDVTAQLAYDGYSTGSCMYGVFNSVIVQLAEKIGEPFASFPTQMMQYGHGGVSGTGTVCGTLNGAAALIGLLVEEKKIQDLLVAELFRIYESTSFPVFKPNNPILDFIPPTSVAKSFLCHASIARWGKASRLRIDGKERKERCRRLTADIAAQTVTILNAYHENTFIANSHDNESVRTCMTCHGKEGKLGNATGKMNCTSCHPKTLGHKIFGDSHYKFMKKK